MNTPRTSTAAFGLVAWLEQTRIYLPLKAIECRFQVLSVAVSVEIEQVFHQSARQALDVTYSFPLPSKAAVYRCEMVVNDRTIRAKVVEQEAAREIAMRKRAEGRRTALVEMERGNLFTLFLGNVQPDDVIVIRFAYFEELDAWQDELALQIPFSPGVRYIPGEPLFRINSGKGATDDTDQVPDASRISPPRIDEMHPDAARLSLSGKLDARDVDLCSISSPTHATAVRPKDNAFEIFLPANAAVPDRDFMLRWRHASRPDLLPVAWISSDEVESYALIELRAPDNVPVETNRDGIDAYFLVDRSGSMSGEKWAKAAEALIEFVKATTPSDRVWITFFESGYRDFAEKPLERDALLRDPDFQSIARLGTGGGTELLPTLRHVLKTHQRFSARRRSHIILITDGQVGNEEAVLQAVSGRALPVHCFGIDHAVNEAFLRQLAGQQRGTSVFLTPNDDLVRPIAILGSRLSRPVLTHVTLDGGWELAGAELPDIYAGQVAFASVRKRGRRSDLNVTGRDADGRPLTVSLEARAAETNLPKLIWMKRRIESLLQAGKDRKAIALAEKANLVCRGAAFIAWDDAEQVAIAEDEIYQPSLQAQAGVLRQYRIGSKALFSQGSYSRPMVELQVTLERCFDEELVGGILDLDEPRLAEQLNRTIETVFCASDARKLADIMQDWAKHADEKQVREALRALLHECKRERNPAHLRKVLSDFFLALPNLWKTEASGIFAVEADKSAPGSQMGVEGFNSVARGGRSEDRKEENSPGGQDTLLETAPSQEEMLIKGESDNEEDDDPWRNVSAADLAAVIDRALIEDRDEAPPSGRVFVPNGEVSLRSALLAAAPGDNDTQALLEEMGDIEETVTRFTDTPPERVVWCSCTGSRLSGSWGLLEFRLGARGYLYFEPDDGIVEEEDALPIYGAWEPADDPAARRACILGVYARKWDSIGLPPFFGEWATAEPGLLQEAILRVLAANPEAWEMVFDRLADAPEPREAAVQTVEEVAKLAASPTEHVRQVLHLVAAGVDQFERRLRTGALDDKERRIVVALLVHCIAQNPFGF